MPVSLYVTSGQAGQVGARWVRQASVRVREGADDRAVVHATYDHTAEGATTAGNVAGKGERSWTLFGDPDRGQPVAAVATAEVRGRVAVYVVRDAAGAEIGTIRRVRGGGARLSRRTWSVETSGGQCAVAREGERWAWALYGTLGLPFLLLESVLAAAVGPQPATGQGPRVLTPAFLVRWVARFRPRAVDLRTGATPVLKYRQGTPFGRYHLADRAGIDAFPGGSALLAALVLLHDDDRRPHRDRAA
ncbi:hypothetical protein OG216_44910 [Streptomycetaceae bacterium NBC_01309]